MSFAVAVSMRLGILSIVLAACIPTPPPATPESPAPLPARSPAPVASSLPSIASPAPGPGPATPQPGHLEHSMRNCPTAVPGATVSTANSEFGVEIQVTAPDPTSQRRIIELAEMHEHMGDPDGSARRHTGLHGGPGGLGRCPVIHSATTVRFTRIRKGAVIHVHALVPEDAARVQAIIAERLAYIAER